MDCDRFAQALTDHALGAALEPRVAAHVSGCERCRARLADERRVVSSIDDQLHAALTVELSAGFAARVHARLAEVPRDDRQWSPWWTYAAVAAAVLLAVAATVIIRREPPAAIISAPAPAPAPVVAELAPRLASAPPPALSSTPAMAPAVAPRPVIARRREPVVLVPPGQEDSLRRLLQQMHDRRIDSAALAGGPEPAAPGIVPLIETSIVPISIEPLFPVPAGEKPGGLQP